MGAIGRIISWVVEKSIYMIIGKKDFIPTPVSDDWPPDGSMHFLRFDRPVGSAGLPLNAIQYEFAANVGEDDPMVFTLGQEIIFRLCESRKILMVFSFDSHQQFKRQKNAVPPAEIVTQFIRSMSPEAAITQKENTAACLTVGYPKKVFSQYQATSEMPCCFIDTYLFSEAIVPVHPQEGLLLIKQGKYQANLYLDYGPNALNLVLDPEVLDIAEVEKIIENVCHIHKIPLINPP